MLGRKVESVERKEGVATLYAGDVRIEIPEEILKVPIGDRIRVTHSEPPSCHVAFKGCVLGRSDKGTLVSNGGLLLQTSDLDHLQTGDAVCTYVSFL